MLKKRILSKVKRTINLASHLGINYSCPICGFKSKDLSPIGLDLPVLKEKQVIGAGRRIGGCYKCGSTDRDRLIYVYLRDKVNIFNNKSIKILHFAPERIIMNILMKSGLENYICGDLFTETYQYPDYVRNMNVLNIPFEDNYFDLILCNHLLEHVPADIDAMKEIYRVLKPNGEAMLQVPISKKFDKTIEDFSVTDPKERETLFGQFDHVRIYGQDYVDRLNSVGLKVERVNISKEYPKYGLNPEEDLFIGRK